MNVHHYRQAVKEELEDEAEKLAVSIASGGASDFPAYREKVGRYKQIKELIQLLDQTLVKLEKKDDE